MTLAVVYRGEYIIVCITPNKGNPIARINTIYKSSDTVLQLVKKELVDAYDAIETWEHKRSISAELTSGSR